MSRVVLPQGTAIVHKQIRKDLPYTVQYVGSKTEVAIYNALQAEKSIEKQAIHRARAIGILLSPSMAVGEWARRSPPLTLLDKTKLFFRRLLA